MIARPTALLDRERAWADLIAFANASAPSARLGVVYGRRRQGKSFLLRQAVQAIGGLHLQALEEGRTAALRRVGDRVAQARGLPAGLVQPTDWPQALRLLADAALATGAARPLVVLDEFPYLLTHSPELPSALQAALDDHNANAGRPIGWIVCGSALSVMTDLLSGSRALRGRATLELVLGPFEPPVMRQFWGIADLDIALIVHAIVGGTPGYRDLLLPAPQTPAELTAWLAAGPLSPAHALFREAEYVLGEDPRIADRALYHSLLDAISRGERTPTRIAGRIGRPEGALRHPLRLLEEAGFVHKTEDLLRQRHATWTVADPIVRFAHLVLRPNLVQLEERRAVEVWRSVAPTFATQIVGPHFEHLCRTWMRTTVAQHWLGQPIGACGPATVTDAVGRTQYELDVVALAPDGGAAPRALFIGEAKGGTAPRTLADLAKLERARAALTATGRVDASEAQLLLFSRAGFDANLVQVARARPGVRLLGLEAVFGA